MVTTVRRDHTIRRGSWRVRQCSRQVCLNLQDHTVPTLLVLKPNTNSIASMTFDLPLPFGPTTDVKFCRHQTTARLHTPSRYTSITVRTDVSQRSLVAALKLMPL